MKELFFGANFGNNAGFSYDGAGESTFIDPPGSKVNNPVPIGAYNSSSGLLAEITGPSQPEASA